MINCALVIVVLLGILISYGCGPDMGAGKGASIGVAAAIKKCRCGELDKGVCIQCPDKVDSSNK